MIDVTRNETHPRSVVRFGGQDGSALILAMFVLALLTAIGASLLFVTGTESTMGQVDLRGKRVYFASEAGLEDARETLRIVNKTDVVVADRLTLDDELVTAAGPSGVLDTNPAALKATFDSAGNPTGFTGYGNDVPLRAMTVFGDHRYLALLTNDAIDGTTSTNDTNDRVMITAAAAGPRNAFEVVQAVVERFGIPDLPAAITILGPAASFDGGTSNAKHYIGTDCTVAGLNVPTVGVIGPGSETSAETGVHKPGSYTSGTETGKATVDDISATIDPNWNDCEFLLNLARQVRAAADVVGTSATPNSQLGTPGAPRVVFIDGDYEIKGSFSGAGLLWVTGELTLDGRASWQGVILAVGQGELDRQGAGNGSLSGAILVADVAGPDGVMWTSDDCAGQDAVVGTADDGVASSTYQNGGGGAGETRYCLRDINTALLDLPFKIVEFRQF